jgi:hypothetical protein
MELIYRKEREINEKAEKSNSASALPAHDVQSGSLRRGHHKGNRRYRGESGEW